MKTFKYSIILCALLRLATATDEHCSKHHPYKASPADALDAARVTRSTVARWARTRRNWVKRWDGRASALATIARDDASLCTPPKSGSTALFARFRRAKRVDWLDDQAIKRVFYDLPKEKRVAVVRHPVLRAVSAFRAGRVRDERENKHMETVADFVARLACDTRLPCEEARLRVNQHWRSQRCFCGFDVPGVRERTSIFAFCDADDALAAVGGARDPSVFDRRTYTSHSTKTPAAVSQLREVYGNATVDALYAAVRPDLEYFRELWPPKVPPD